MTVLALALAGCGVPEPVPDCDASVWFADADGDGFGDPRSGVAACDQPAGFIADNADCNDSRADVNPDGVEACDGVDDDFECFL
jgi:hypothetical protein